MYYRIQYEVLPMRGIRECEVDTDKEYKAIEALNAWAEGEGVQVKIIKTELIEY